MVVEDLLRDAGYRQRAAGLVPTETALKPGEGSHVSAALQQIGLGSIAANS